MRMPAATHWTFIIASAALGGCAAKSKVEAPSGPESALILLDELPATGTLTANNVQPLTPGTETYLRLSDDGAIEGKLIVKREPTDRFGATVAVSDNEGRIQFLRADDQGNVVMTAVIEEADQAISRFDPPLVVAFAELAPGTPRSSQSKMRVVDWKNQSKLREEGTATRTMSYVRDQRVRTPSGEFVAKCVEVHFAADLKLADADEKTAMFIVPGVGEIAELGAETVKVFGAFGKTVRHANVLDLQATVSAASQPAPPLPAHSPDAAPQH